MRSRRLALGLSACWLTMVWLLGSAVASNQIQAVGGRVIDPHGRAVMGALVQLECPIASSSVLTDANGRFSFFDPPAGTCALTVAAKGFENQRQAGVELGTEAALGITVQLKVAVVKEVVNVTRERELTQADLTVDEVRESSARDLGEALTRIDGIWKVRKGGIANDVVLRGFQHGNLDVLIDGARIYGACPNSMDPAVYHVDFAEIQEVEVTKGPFDVKDQGGLGGTISIVNKRPGSGLAVRPTFSVGSFGFYNPAITASKGNDLIKVLTGYSYRMSRPYEDGLGRSFTTYANYNPALDPRAFDIHTGWFVADFNPTANQHISLAYTRQQSGLVLYPYLLMDADHDNADRVNLNYEVRNPTSNVSAYRVQAYLTQVKHFMTDTQRTSAIGALAPFSMATHAGTLAAGGHMEADVGRSITLGIEMFQRNWNAVNYMRRVSMNLDQPVIPDVGTLATGAYAAYRHSLGERFRIGGGVRVDQNATQTRATAPTDLYYAYQGTRRSSASDTAPSANLQLTIIGPKPLEFFVAAGSGVRFPDAQERFFQQRKMGQDVVGNPLLLPTRNTQSSMGVSYKRGSSYARTEVFYAALSDFITVHNQGRINAIPGVMNTMARSFQNVDGRIYGGESSYALAFPQQVLLSGGISYARGIKNTNPQAQIFNSDIVEMPPLRTWMALRYTHRLFFTEISGVAVNRQGRVDTDLRETPTAGYGLLNLQLGVHPGKLYLILFVDNVLNRYYFEHFSAQRDPFRSGVKVPEPGRNVFATVAYSF